MGSESISISCAEQEFASTAGATADRARSSAPSRAHELREYLLQLTVAHARQLAPYYRETLPEYDAFIKLGDLHRLPLLQKQVLKDHVDALRTFTRFPDFLMYTSGTTGEPLEVPVYREEVEAFDDLVVRPLQARVGERRLTLAVLRVGHGSHVLTANIPTIPCHINYGMDQLVHFLRTRHWLDGQRVRITNLEANVLNMRQITKELLEVGIDPREFELETIAVSGWYVPVSERVFLQETWNAVLLDRYGVTEVNGDAKWCHECAAYHFDFMVVAEVLDPDTLTPIDRGVGYVVLTGLFPFNQAIPKIRYFVGDLVQVQPATCGTREPAVTFLSRGKDAVRDTQSGVYRVFSSDVVEVLAPMPDVARKPTTGFVKFRLSTRPDTEARIEIELVYPPEKFAHRVAALEADVRSSLSQRRPHLGRPEIQFLRPGDLSSITKV